MGVRSWGERRALRAWVYVRCGGGGIVEFKKLIFYDKIKKTNFAGQMSRFRDVNMLKNLTKGDITIEPDAQLYLFVQVEQNIRKIIQVKAFAVRVHTL
jgi:hypothetical protein